MNRRRSGGLSPADTKAGRLQRAVLAQIELHREEGTIPTNGRFLFYELEQLGVVPKKYPDKVRQPRQDISDALTHLREIGLVAWREIRDERREFTSFKTRPTVAEYVADSVERASIDRWGGKPAPMIICESESVYGVLFDTAARYASPITHTSGQARGHLITEVAPNLKPGQRVIYLGDYDLAGAQIEEHTQRTVIDHSLLAPRSRVLVRRRWERLLLTREQIDADPRLLELVIRKVDRRFKTPVAFDAVEAETIGQRRLVDMVRARLDELVPEPIDDVLVRQDRERAGVAEQLRRLRDGDEP